MKAVHFGAGNIGRGFIGALLNQSGYDVIFVDVNGPVVNRINDEGQYKVILAEANEQTELVTGVRALNSQLQGQEVESVIAEADIITAAVGVSNLKYIAPILAKGLLKRSTAVNVIACENAIGAGDELKKVVEEAAGEAASDLKAAFPNAAVDRIVPNQSMESLDVRVEPYFEWVVEESRMVTPIPSIKGIHYVPDLGPYIERKLFTVNTGHAATAYLGFRKNVSTIDEALQDPSIKKTVEDTLAETSSLLEIKHGFDADELEAYRKKIVGRFENPFITDEIMRVGRSPQRKLGPNDRLTGPAIQLFNRDVEPKALIKVIAAALHFMNQNDSEAEEMHAVIEKEGIEKAVTLFTGIETSNPLHEAIVKSYRED